MMRYTVLRLLIFFGVLCTLWLVGVKDPVPLLIASALISAILSLVLLREMRDEIAAGWMARREAKKSGRPIPSEDELAEDAEAEAEDAEAEDERR